MFSADELLNHKPKLELCLTKGNPLPHYYWYNRRFNFVQAVRLGDYVVTRDREDYLNCVGVGFWLQPDSPLRDHLMDLDDEGQHHTSIPDDLFADLGGDEHQRIERIEGFFELDFLNLARLAALQAQTEELTPVPVAYERFAPTINSLKQEILDRMKVLEQLTDLKENTLPCSTERDKPDAREALFDITQCPPNDPRISTDDPYSRYAPTPTRTANSPASPLKAP